MNVFIVIRNGIPDTPILVSNNTTTQAQFDELAFELIGEDVNEIGLHFDEQLLNLNNLINKDGIEVHWFERVDVNEYIN